MTSLRKQWENLDFFETRQIICHLKGNDESFSENVLVNEIEFLNQKLYMAN